MPENEFLTFEEARQILRISKGTLSVWIKKGRINAVRLSRKKVLIRREEIDRFIKDSESQPKP